jgi:CRP-like cAMP-binding protein
MSVMSNQFNNAILSSLCLEDLDLLTPLSPVDLPKRRRLELRNRKIENIFFLENGVASVVARDPEGFEVEIAMVGSEGMTGDSVVLGAEKTFLETFMQIAGNGRSIPAARLVIAMAASPSLRSACVANSRTLAIALTALSNARNTLSARLARWLLMTDDRVAGGDLPLTHEFLSVMMGVRRAGVTIALNEFLAAVLIQKERGHIRVTDRTRTDPSLRRNVS